MILYGLKNCDTCRKALKALPQAEFVDVRAEGVPEEVLERALLLFGDGVVNTRSTTWRELDFDERNAPPLALLQSHPSLMKRPLIIEGEEMWLGWGKDVQAALAERG